MFGSIFKFLRPPRKRDIFRDMNKENKKNKEVWHYTCECGNKWESYSSPKGTYVYGESGQTKCPKCKSPVCCAMVYINGKYVNMGACHVGWKEK